MAEIETRYKEKIEKYLTHNFYKTLPREQASTLAPALMDILESKIEKFYITEDQGQSKSKENKEIKEIFALLTLLSDFISKNNGLKDRMRNSFEYIHNQIKIYLHIKPTSADGKKALSRYRILQNIMNKLENTMLMLYMEKPIDYDPHKEEFIHYLLFKQKSFFLVEEACHHFPHLVNLSDEKTDEPLIYKVLTEYLKSLDEYLKPENLGPLDNLLYYDKVLESMCFNEKMKLDPKTQKEMLEKINKFFNTHNYSFTSDRKKEKLVFFIRIAENHILKQKEPNDIKYLSYKYEIHLEFKQAYLTEAQHLKLQKNFLVPTTSLRKIYTFDSEGAKEIDDGLSIIYSDGIYHLGVHIADPTAYISHLSILMTEAKRRTTSIYIGDECIPMFPFELSGDLMSMNENKNTHCLSYYFDIAESDGHLIDFTARSEIVRVAGNKTYEDFNKTAELGSPDKDYENTVYNLLKINKYLKNVYNEDPTYHAFHNDRDKSTSMDIVANCMIYTNYQVAKWFSAHNLPFIYRCHKIDEMDQNYLTALKESIESNQSNAKIVRTINILKNQYPRAYYSLSNKGHQGLGIPYYSHDTSPLRRYADIIAIMCIKKFMLSSNYNEDDVIKMESIIEEASSIINAKQNTIRDYESKVLSLKNNTNSANK